MAVSKLMKKSISDGGSLSDRIRRIIIILAKQNTKPIGPNTSITIICVSSSANTSLHNPTNVPKVVTVHQVIAVELPSHINNTIIGIKPINVALARS